ncbi:MAG: apolipoprotein N-acyltransferase, partial [Dermatophilaceae bacterium]
MRRLLLALGSGGLLCLAFPTFDIWVAAPLALAVLAWALTGVRTRVGAGLGLAAGLAFFVPTLHWSGIYVGALPWLALSTLEALFFAVAGGLYAWLSRGGQVRPLAFALVWVVTEGFRGRAPYGGFPWVKLAFGQADSPFGRLVALGGPPFVGFIIALVGGLLALVVSRAL